jgi:hypothetical protein
LLGAVVTIFVTIALSQTYPKIQRHYRVVFSLLLLGSSVFTIALYRSMASEVSSQMSPDGRYKVVVYRLPYLSSTPGSGLDAPAILRLFDAAGNRLASTDLPMLQMAEVVWFPGKLEVGYFNFDLPE